MCSQYITSRGNEHAETETEFDAVNHPKHYTSHPSGIEAIKITRHCTSNIGNVIKYCMRHGLKGGQDTAIQDLKKAAFYLADEIERLEQIENEKCK